MTQAKIKKIQKENENNEKAKLGEQCEGKQRPWYMQDRYVHGTAWILLTIGLCIIVITFYLAIHEHKNVQSKGRDYDENYSDYMDNSVAMIELNKTVRAVDDNQWADFNPDLQGCQELFCKVRCREAYSIYEEIYQVLNLSTCQIMDVLVIDNQYWPHGVVKNHWRPVNNTVREMVLSSSPVKRIRNGAFNAPIFSNTFRLSWLNLNLSWVDSGALLGLHSLKYLSIDTPVPNLDRAFFQPVQTTLKSLKLYAGLSIAEDYNIFGISQLNALEYADLSYNNFNGPLTEKMLLATPNLKYLVITNAKITCIERNAFVKLAGTLVLLNLSQNLFTTTSADIFTPLLETMPLSFLNLAMNNWNCNCKLREFARIYSKHRSQFIDTLYCKAPHRVYGTALDEVDFSYCDITVTTLETNFEEIDVTESTSTKTTTTTTTMSTTSSTAANWNADTTVSSTNYPMLTEGDGEQPEDPKLFQMRCLSLTGDDDLVTTTDDSVLNDNGSESIAPFDESRRELTAMNDDKEANTSDANQSAASSYSSGLEYFEFEPPDHDFELELLGNHSVQVTIYDFKKPVTIIWFNEELNSTNSKDVGSYKGYNCMVYANPYLIVDHMLDNTTYTFCLMLYYDQEITPFNCLPLHIPAAVQGEENVWISMDAKAFTVGILCLIFTMSIFFGAVVAYFGIKTYPDLLEGSKNVLVVKKPEQNCYVSTITETEYMTQSSFKKKPLGGASIKQKPGLPETPSSMPTLPYSISARDLERLPSMKSSSTCFEDAFVPIRYPEDEYEMPTSFEKEHIYKERCVPNNYATSPALPPPLPKRNSSIPENVVVNRFGIYN